MTRIYMPELPEVETIRRDLEDLIVGYQIVGIDSDSPKQVQPSLGLVATAIQGATLLRVDRRAKILLFLLDKQSFSAKQLVDTRCSSNNGKILAVHLKLTGRLIVRKAGAPKDEWQRAVIKLKKKRIPETSSGQALKQVQDDKGQVQDDKDYDLELRFCDARKFGWIRLLSNLGHLGDLGKYGPEPFDKEFTAEYLQKIFSKTSKPIKIILIDQEKIAGIGNIYANEALFLAKIDPRRPAKSLRVSEFKSLRNAIIKVLELGLKYGGASDQYYLNAKGEKGSYQEHFLVYGKQGQNCPNHAGSTIKRIVVGGRGTFFCPKCQC